MTAIAAAKNDFFEIRGDKVYFPEIDDEWKIRRGRLVEDEFDTPIVKEDREGDILYFPIYDPFYENNSPFSSGNHTNRLDKTVNFSRRPENMVRAIREGYADSITQTQLFGIHSKAVRFVDREIGEKFRKLTLEGWKDVKYGYFLSLPGFGFGGDSHYNSDGMSSWKDEKKYFSTEQEAWDKAKEFVETAIKINEKYGEFLCSKIGEHSKEEEEAIFSQLDKDGYDFDIVKRMVELMHYRDEYSDKPAEDRFRNGACVDVYQVVLKD